MPDPILDLRNLTRRFGGVLAVNDISLSLAPGELFSERNGGMQSAGATARESLEFTGLAAHADYRASELSLADRKRLELAKSLAMQPRLLFLDEVNAGLNTSELDGALALIRAI